MYPCLYPKVMYTKNMSAYREETEKVITLIKQFSIIVNENQDLFDRGLYTSDALNSMRNIKTSLSIIPKRVIEDTRLGIRYTPPQLLDVII